MREIPTRFLSREECLALLARADGFKKGGGSTGLSIESTWVGNLRWARNRIISSGDVRNNDIWLSRTIRGARSEVILNEFHDAPVHAAVRRAERLLQLESEMPTDRPADRPPRPHLRPTIWSDTTYGLDAEHRAEAMRPLIDPVIKAGMFAAGYIEVSAQGRTVLNSEGRTMYYPYTKAQYSVTVRDPQGTGSGWAGVDSYDWEKIDADRLSEIALDKCLRSRNPVAVEPGRYTAILEPQAVCDLCSPMIEPRFIDRLRAEQRTVSGPYSQGNAMSRIGQQMIDPRISITADPMDPEIGVPPFDRLGSVYSPVTWFENGVLKNLAYMREYAIRTLGTDIELPPSGAYRMSGGNTSIAEMIRTTKRGLLVTRFSDIAVLDEESLLMTGFTRDGLWLIENGQISKPVKNFRITESPLFALNNVEQLGVPQRVFHPLAPVVVPPLKVRDFSFTSLVDAV
jgi:predicted Zn-dependent protease